MFLRVNTTSSAPVLSPAQPTQLLRMCLCNKLLVSINKLLQFFLLWIKKQHLKTLNPIRDCVQDITE